MADFVHFLGLLGHKIHMLRYIELKQAKNMWIDSTKRINWVSLKNIDIGQLMDQKVSKKYQSFHIRAYVDIGQLMDQKFSKNTIF